jgi:RNA polymerase sigma factor (sigma-70 family)
MASVRTRCALGAVLRSAHKQAGGRALFRDNYSVNPRAPGVPTQRVNVVEPSSGKRDERELIASVLRKDRKAAARLVAAHIDAVYSYVRHRLAPHADLVDDVVQDVFLSALKGLAAFESQSSLRTWLVAIARHKIDDIYRQRLRTALVLNLDSTEDEPTANEIPLDEQIDKARAGAKTRRVLERMPERYALILLWRYWGTAKRTRRRRRDRHDGEERRAVARAGTCQVQRTLVEGVTDDRRGLVPRTGRSDRICR